MENNNKTIKKMYYGNSLVNMAVASGGELDIPANLSAVEFDDYGRMTSVTLKNGVTSIPEYWQANNKSLSSCTIPSSVTSIGGYAFSSVGSGNSLHAEIKFDVSGINLSSVIADSTFTNTFNSSFLKGNITIPNSLLSGATSGYGSPCYSMFTSSLVFADNNDSLNINVYANNVIIPKSCFNFTSVSNRSDGLNITIYGTPTFLAATCLGCSTGATVTFADCTTPPDAESYGTANTSPFYNFKGTLYVPSAGLTAWKNKYTGIASKIKAIGT